METSQGLQIFTYLAAFWIGWLGILVPTSLIVRIVK